MHKEVVVTILTVVVLCVVALSGCSDEDGTTKLLLKQGYTNIHITGYQIWRCGKGDFYHTGFQARAPITGSPVEGVVCAGWLKGSTIRFDD